MAIKLEKGQRINLEKSNGSKLTNFCVGCNWGAVQKTVRKEFVINEGFLGFGRKTEWRTVLEPVDVDLDLSCMMFDENGSLVDVIFSDAYPKGNRFSRNNAFVLSQDDTEGDLGGDDGLDNEVITVDLTRANSDVHSAVFMLNIYVQQGSKFKGDFSEIPYAYIRMYEGTPVRVNSVFAQYDVATKSNCQGKRSLILGKLYRHNGDWKFAAIGDAYDDNTISDLFKRVMKDYSK